MSQITKNSWGLVTVHRIAWKAGKSIHVRRKIPVKEHQATETTKKVNHYQKGTKDADDGRNHLLEPTQCFPAADRLQTSTTSNLPFSQN
jgi:hypothetical protein